MSQTLPSGSAGKDPIGVRCLEWEPRDLRQVSASSFLLASLLPGEPHGEHRMVTKLPPSAAPSLGRRSVRLSCEFPDPGLSLRCLFSFFRKRLSVEEHVLSREVFFVVDNSHLRLFIH